MIAAPTTLQGRKSVYAVVPNSKRLGGYLPEKCYVFADVNIAPVAGDLAVCIDADFNSLTPEDVVTAQIVSVRQDSKGKLYGQISSPEEKIVCQNMHKVIMVVME